MTGVDSFVSGSVEVFCLTDGDTVFGPEVFPTLDDASRQDRLAKAGLAEVASQFNVYVLRHAGGVDLVDTGCGTLFGAKAGRMGGLLADLGISAGDVARVIYTHLHRDHVGGALQDGRLVYPNAEVLLHSAEAAHWQTGAGSEPAPGPGAAMLAVAEHVTLLEDDADLGQGMRLWHLPGHTPGHCGLVIGNLVLVGDIVHSEALQLPDPSLSPIYDTDGAQSVVTRRAALDRIARHGLVWSGSHMLGPRKFARLVAAGAGFVRTTL